MKKVFGLLLAAGILGTLAFTGVQKIPLVEEHACYPDASGFVITNTTPNGTTDAAIQIQLRRAEPNHFYTVKTAGVDYGDFKTNMVGNGGMHLNLVDQDVIGGAINIWDGGTRCWRAKY